MKWPTKVRSYLSVPSLQRNSKSGNLKKHERTHNEGKLFACSKCDNTFKEREAIWLFKEWYSFWTKGSYAKAWKDPQRREFICLLQVWLGIYREWHIEEAWKDPHRREVMPVPTVTRHSKRVNIWKSMKGLTQETSHLHALSVKRPSITMKF